MVPPSFVLIRQDSVNSPSMLELFPYSNPIGLSSVTTSLCTLSFRPLIQVIQQDRNIIRIVFNDEIHKISLYADNVLIYLPEPLNSVSRLMDYLASFCKLSDYKVNGSKTKALAWN